jgi:hypothetical protein
MCSCCHERVDRARAPSAGLTAAVGVETVEDCSDEQTEPMGMNGLVVVEPVPASGFDPTG